MTVSYYGDRKLYTKMPEKVPRSIPYCDCHVCIDSGCQKIRRSGPIEFV